MLSDREIEEAVLQGMDEAEGIPPTARALLRGLELIKGQAKGAFDYTYERTGDASGVRIDMIVNKGLSDEVKSETIIPASGDVILDGINFNKDETFSDDRGIDRLRTQDEAVAQLLIATAKFAIERRNARPAAAYNTAAAAPPSADLLGTVLKMREHIAKNSKQAKTGHRHPGP